VTVMERSHESQQIHRKTPLIRAVRRRIVSYSKEPVL
jgi:hypothetical protein